MVVVVVELIENILEASCVCQIGSGNSMSNSQSDCTKLEVAVSTLEKEKKVVVSKRTKTDFVALRVLF